MNVKDGIQIKINDKVIGVINIDERAFKDTCGEDNMDVLKNAGDLVAIAIKTAANEREMIALNSVQSDFISSFPHELRIPMAVIKDSLSMLLEGVMGEINEKQRKALQLASNNVERLWRLNEELLQLSEIASAKSPMKRKLFDIAELIAGALKKQEQPARDKKVSVAADMPGKKAEIWGDYGKLDKAIGHLLDNAIKYNNEGGRVDLRLEESDAGVTIRISDTGKGIPPEDLGKIFDSFFRVTMRTTGAGKKWGVGLPIVKEIITMHRGNISLESEVGKGSAFIITLPKNLR